VLQYNYNGERRKLMEGWLLVLVALACVLGSVVAGWLGWIESKEPFDARKFGSSTIRGIIAGIVLALTINYSTLFKIEPVFLNIFAAFVFGAGFDVLGNRAAGATAARNATTST
jgi:MFS family permease